MKYCNTVIFILVVAIGFSACSKDGNGDGSRIVIDCNATQGVTPTLYTPMQSGDTLIKLSTQTVVNTYQNANGTKTICTQEGVAQLIKK